MLKDDKGEAVISKHKKNRTEDEWLKHKAEDTKIRTSIAQRVWTRPRPGLVTKGI